MDGTKERRIRSRIDTQQLLRDKFDAAVEGHNAALAKLQLAAADGLQVNIGKIDSSYRKAKYRSQ